MQRSFLNSTAVFLVWLVVAASAVYWSLQFVRGPAELKTNVVTSVHSSATFDAQTFAKGFGVSAGSAAPVSSPSKPLMAASRFTLRGIAVSPSGSKSNIALISVDGQPARPIRVGSIVVEDLVLRSVSTSEAVIGSLADASNGFAISLPRR